MKLSEIEEAIRKCRDCPLYRTRRNPVPGEGPENAKIMFVGEAPGQREDEQGRPFCGPAGKVLDELLEIAGIQRSSVYITNVLKCRPPNNREPRPEEVEACKKYLKAQIEAIKPVLIVTLGRHAFEWFRKEYGLQEKNVSLARGKVFTINNLFGDSFRLFVTYHPAVALYNPKTRLILEEDFRKLGELVKKLKIL